MTREHTIRLYSIEYTNLPKPGWMSGLEFFANRCETNSFVVKVGDSYTPWWLKTPSTTEPSTLAKVTLQNDVSDKIHLFWLQKVKLWNWTKVEFFSRILTLSQISTSKLNFLSHFMTEFWLQIQFLDRILTRFQISASKLEFLWHFSAEFWFHFLISYFIF